MEKTTPQENKLLYEKVSKALDGNPTLTVRDTCEKFGMSTSVYYSIRKSYELVSGSAAPKKQLGKRKPAVTNVPLRFDEPQSIALKPASASRGKTIVIVVDSDELGNVLRGLAQ